MENKYAVLIDSDNISPDYVEGIFNELSNYGDTPIRRIYGDFEGKKNWRQSCLNYSIKQIQQYNNTKGKNSTDSSLIIDAMDILYQYPYITGFVIVSSDSDFTGLSQRIREAAKEVIGMGETKTPKSIINACTSFKYLENLVKEEDKKPVQDIGTSTKDLEKRIIEIITSKNGLILVSQLKEHLIKIYPDFDEKNYGFNQMNKFLSSFQSLKVETIKTACYVSCKQNEKADASNKEEMDKTTLEIVSKAKGKKIALSLLSQKLIDQGFDYSLFGYSKFRKYLQTFKVLDVDNIYVSMKEEIK